MMPDSNLDLPDPDPTARDHSRRVAAAIRSAIDTAGGAIPFAEYMRLALYAPGLGYYQAGAEKLGAGGDFVTAPEVSALFGEVIGRQLGETLAAAGGDTILELGAGTGRLALTLLRALAAEHRLPTRYLILEVSGDLASRQRETLAADPEISRRVEWIDRLPEQSFNGIILANEVADALPVERFLWSADAARRLGVKTTEAGFTWAEMDLSPELAVRIGTLGKRYAWTPPYASEINPHLDAWIASLAAVLRRGVMLFIDYGLPEHEYYHPTRHRGTLICHFRQRAHEDPFRWPGLTDISAWVDFSALARAGTAAGLEVAGYTTQGNFLLEGGIGSAIGRATGDIDRYRLAGEIKRLVLPDEMGETFKVLALARDCAAPSAVIARNLDERLVLGGR